MNLLQMLGLAGQTGNPLLNPPAPAPGTPPIVAPVDAGQPGLDPRLPQGTGGLPTSAGGLGAILGGQQPQQWHGLGGYLKALLPTIQQLATGVAETGSLRGGFGVMRENKQQNLENQIKLATLAAKGEQPSTVQELIAAGIKPGTKEFHDAIVNHLTGPHWVLAGDPETGQTAVNVNAPQGTGMTGTAPAAPPVGGTYTDPDTGHVYKRVGQGLGPDSWQIVGGPSQAGSGTF